MPMLSVILVIAIEGGLLLGLITNARMAKTMTILRIMPGRSPIETRMRMRMTTNIKVARRINPATLSLMTKKKKIKNC